MDKLKHKQRFSETRVMTRVSMLRKSSCCLELNKRGSPANFSFFFKLLCQFHQKMGRKMNNTQRLQLKKERKIQTIIESMELPEEPREVVTASVVVDNNSSECEETTGNNNNNGSSKKSNSIVQKKSNKTKGRRRKTAYRENSQERHCGSKEHCSQCLDSDKFVPINKFIDVKKFPLSKNKKIRTSKLENLNKPKTPKISSLCSSEKDFQGPSSYSRTGNKHTLQHWYFK